MNFAKMVMQANGLHEPEEPAKIELNLAMLTKVATGQVKLPDSGKGKSHRPRVSQAKYATSEERKNSPANVAARAARAEKLRELALARYEEVMKGKGKMTIKDIAITVGNTQPMTLIYIKKLIASQHVKHSGKEKVEWSARRIDFYEWLKP